MRVGVVTVTYGDRISYLTKVIERLSSLEISQICVVVNGSPKNLFLELSKFDKVNFIFNPTNSGSAKGFKQGINFLQNRTDIDYIWLLDDDNLPEIDALKNIKNYYNSITFNEEKDALLSYRPDRKVFLKAVESNNGSAMLKGKNSALGFSIFGSDKQYSDYRKGGLKVAPYGGLFFNKKIIERIGFPDETYFLYGDDYDFTIRISKGGGRIMLVKDSIINDLEVSFHLNRAKKNIFLNTRYHKTENLDQIFYSVRNGIKFELKHMADKKSLYFLNLFSYSLIIGILLILNPKKNITFFKGVLFGILNRT